MTIAKKAVIILGAILLGATASINFALAQDTPMTDAQINQIKSNCLSAKGTMAQLHANDALIRVNRGQMYESMATKLMSRFNDRVGSNHLNSKYLVSVTQDYNTALTTFRNDYQLYEESLSSALKIDCTKEPVSFYDAVADARTKRAQVHSDVLKLHQYIDQYKTAFDEFVTGLMNFTGSSN
jgi:hypothetical protein